jgi:hypothetical protein
LNIKCLFMVLDLEFEFPVLSFPYNLVEHVAKSELLSFI